MKKIPLILCAIGGVAVAMFVFVVSGAFSVFMPKPSEPQIKYGEFPFCLKYELNGEIKVIEDVIVCEYKGYKSYGTAGKKREWNTRLKSGNELLVLSDLRSKNFTDKLNNKILELYFYYGNDKYFMENGKSVFAHGAQDFDEICYTFQSKKGEISHSSFDAEYALKEFGIRLISWECAPPVENKFE